jgi:hypothetical protein
MKNFFVTRSKRFRHADLTLRGFQRRAGKT